MSAHGEIQPKSGQGVQRQDRSDPAIGAMLTIVAGWPEAGIHRILGYEANMTDLELDALILEHVTGRFRKVAMVIAMVSEAAKIDNEDFLLQVELGIKRLVAAQRLIGVGDLSNWRHSEIKSAMQTVLSEETARRILDLMKAHTSSLNTLLIDLLAELPESEHSGVKARIGYIWSEYGEQLGELVEVSFPQLWANYVDGDPKP